MTVPRLAISAALARAPLLATANVGVTSGATGVAAKTE
jgi:hypothetical protein